MAFKLFNVEVRNILGIPRNLEKLGILAVYFRTKSLSIEVHPVGGPVIVVTFRPNVIEGVPVDLAKAKEAVSVMSDLLQAPQQHEVPMPHPATRFPPAVPQTTEQAPDIERARRAEQPHNLADSDEARAKALLDRARQLVAAGDRDGAISVLESIVRNFPRTRAAENAKRNLEKSQRLASSP